MEGVRDGLGGFASLAKFSAMDDPVKKPSPCPGGCRCEVCLSPPFGAGVSFSPCASLSRRAWRAVVCRPAFASAAGGAGWSSASCRGAAGSGCGRADPACLSLPAGGVHGVDRGVPSASGRGRVTGHEAGFFLASGGYGVKGTGPLVGVEGAKPLARSVPAFPNEGGIPPE